MVENIEVIERVNECINVKRAIIVMHDGAAGREIKRLMMERDYPCNSKYHVTTENYLRVFKSMDHDDYNLALLSKRCNMNQVLEDIDPMMGLGTRFIFSIN